MSDERDVVHVYKNKQAWEWHDLYQAALKGWHEEAADLKQQLAEVTQERDELRRYHQAAMEALYDDLSIDKSDGEIRFKWVSLAVNGLKLDLAEAQQQLAQAQAEIEDWRTKFQKALTP